MEASVPLTAEEEAVKRNTDCVYFLASPLTCKKGNECEYRHSEGARVNPRDCWYWLNGNCLNPKCSFRHPPLDGLFGSPAAPSGPAPPSSQTGASTQIPSAYASGAHNPSKQSVPCYYFQKGQCLKGDRCPFVHGPPPSSGYVPQQAAQVSTSFPQTPQTHTWGFKECSAQQNMPKSSVEKPFEVTHSLNKSVNKSETAPNNGLSLEKSASPYPPEYEPPRYLTAIAPVSSDSAPSRPRPRQPQPVEELHQNGRDADEFLAESSPGFDVLVDNDIADSDYYHSKEDFGRAATHGGRNPNIPVSDFDYHHSEYEPVANFEGEQHNGNSEYDWYGPRHQRHDRDPQMTSAERIMDRLSIPERRVRHRERSADEMNGSDLRHRLLKQRRLNGPRSVVSPDRRSEAYRRNRHSVEDRLHRSRPSGKDRRRSPQESSISTRLQGRITLPNRSSPDRPIGLRSERDRDRDRARHRGRLSPPRPINHQGRPHDSIKRRLNEGSTEDGRILGGRANRRDDGETSFAAPKSLAELKGTKASGSSKEQPAKRMDAPLTAGYQASEASLSFEGPKRLSDILKRKRSRDGSVCSSGDENNQRDAEGMITAAASAMPSSSSEAVKEGNYAVGSAEEAKARASEEEEEEEEGLIPTDGDEPLPSGQSSAAVNMHDEVEDGRVGDTIEEDQEMENFDVRDGESDYEAIEGGDFKAEDDENAYQEDEEELDDEDDFAAKVGVLFS